MAPRDDTCWTLVRGAKDGDAQARSLFARTYLSVVRAYLGARWNDTAHVARMDDAVQDIFLECFRENGALDRLDPERGVNFRTFLYAVVRNVALRHEERGARNREQQLTSQFNPAERPGDEERLSTVFDRAWAVALIKRAGDRQRVNAHAAGESAVRRVELLRLRIREGRPIRDVAREWEMDPALLHREYARARQEFKAALRDEVAFHHPGTSQEIERECAALLSLLGKR